MNKTSVFPLFGKNSNIPAQLRLKDQEHTLFWAQANTVHTSALRMIGGGLTVCMHTVRVSVNSLVISVVIKTSVCFSVSNLDQLQNKGRTILIQTTQEKEEKQLSFTLIHIQPKAFYIPNRIYADTHTHSSQICLLIIEILIDFCQTISRS